MLHKIGILSDTHNLLRPEVLAALTGCEQILHGGDISSREILDELEKIAPVSVVRGNNDHEWAEGMPETLDLTVCGLRIFMIHNKKFLPDDLHCYDLVIYGHSHKYEDKEIKGVHYFNPGSCGPRRFHQDITLAILWIDDDAESQGRKSFRLEKILIPHVQSAPGKNAAGQPSIPSRDALIRMLPAIMQEIDSGKTTAQIAGKHKIPQSLSDEIARMYLTHPGVDINGILRRLGM